jgi:hypothetical protein
MSHQFRVYLIPQQRVRFKSGVPQNVHLEIVRLNIVTRLITLMISFLVVNTKLISFSISFFGHVSFGKA